MTQILDVSPKRSNTDLTEDRDYQSVSGRMLSVAVGTGGRLYAGTYANVWRSDDGGRTFTQCTRPQPPVGQFDVPGALGGREVFDLAVSPDDSNVVLAITRSDLRSTPRHGIYRSSDGGDTWTLVHQFPGLPTAAGQIVWPVSDRRVVYAAWGTSVAVSRDGGNTFVDTMPWGSQSGAAYHVAVGFAFAAPAPVYALGNSRIWVSFDRGNNWRLDGGPVPSPSGGATGEAQSNAPSVLVTLPGQSQTVLLITDPADAQLWRGNYETFAATGMSTWTSVPLPDYGTDSGNHFIAAPVDDLIYFCAKSRLFVASAAPQSGAGWRELDDDHHVHVDLHGAFFSIDFNASFSDGEYRRHSGTMWLLSDGGVDRSEDGGRSFAPADVLTTLASVNISGVAQEGTTALCLNTGDNSGFYSLDGGAHWKTQAYLGGDNDCSFADPLQPDRMLVFTPREGGDSRSVTLYINTGGGLPDGRKGTSDGHQVPGPPASHLSQLPSVGFDMPNWNAVSNFALRGYRPIVLTCRGERSLADGDYVFIRYKTDVTAVLLRTQALRQIDADDEWDTLATSADDSHVFQQGPPLPSADVRVVQASGGHAHTVFYVGVDASRMLWKWTDGMAAWQAIVPGATLPGPRPTTPQKAIRFFVDPYRPNILFVVDDVHVWRSDNGGTTWTIDVGLEQQVTNDGAIPTSLDPDDDEALMDVVLQDMQFDPDDARVRFAVGTAGAFFTADGVRWNRLLDAAAIPAAPTSCYYDAVSDPCQRSLYVGFAGRSVLKITPLPWGSLQAPDPAAWSENVRIPNQKSKAAVALAVFRGVIHMVHLGDSSNTIWWSTSTDGINWTPNTPIPGQKSKATPALAVYNDRLHMVHLGDSSNDIWWSIYDGASWNKSDGTPGNERIPDQKSKAAPALAAYGGRLHMVHLGDSSNDIWWSMYDGVSWKKDDGATPGNTRIKGQQSKSSPAFAVFGGRLHMVHLGDSSNNIWWSSFDGNDWWSNTRIRCQKSKAPPALATYNGALHMVHLGDSSNRLWWSMYDGSEWTPNVVIPGQKSKASPALVVTPDGTQLLMVHLGDSSNDLWQSLAAL